MDSRWFELLMTTDLYNPTDKKAVREALTKEQKNLCIITGLPIEPKQHILEHAHDDEMFVRGVASRQANSFLGVIERAWIRYMRWWSPYTLSQTLRQIANYLERPADTRYRHDMWIKKVNTWFNALSEGQKKEVLQELGQNLGNNAKERKALFQKALLTRKFSFDTIRTIINQVKGE